MRTPSEVITQLARVEESALRKRSVRTDGNRGTRPERAAAIDSQNVQSSKIPSAVKEAEFGATG